MSSILEALKKAQQESTTVEEGSAPWPAPASTGSGPRRSSRRWWILSAGLIVLGGIVGATFWTTNRGNPSSPDAAPPVPAQTTHTTASSPPPKPAIPVKERMKTVRPPVRTIPSTSSLPSPAVKPKAMPAAKQPSIQPRRMVRPTVQAPDESDALPATSAAQAPEPTVKQPETPVDKRNRNVRSDPRIDLQALVWAPEASDRFVVINNRLVKEGGSVDTFVVVEIDRDEVLIAEGAERWYERFSIR